MKFITPQIVDTADGSHSLYSKELDETYHSHHGARQESIHVYIRMGLDYVLTKGMLAPNIFELGYGTGLNAFLTAMETEEKGIRVCFDSIEKFPVDIEALKQLNYGLENEQSKALFRKLIDAPWDEPIVISPNFTQQKIYGDFLTFDCRKDYYDVFYFDAFGFRAQSELWSEDSFERCHAMLKQGGALVTYAAKGSARRAMESVGFVVSRLPGAPGKREMLRAVKR